MLSEIVKKITADWYGEVVKDISVSQLLEKLEVIATISVAAAQDRWTVMDSKGLRQVNREAWYADQRVLKIAAGFFADKQSFMPLKAGTLFNRIEKFGPYKLQDYKRDDPNNYYNKYGVEWMESIQSTANTFIKALNKWEKALSKGGGEHAIQGEFKLGPYQVLNMGGYSAKVVDPILKLLEEADTKISSKLQYGIIRLTTSKENRGNNTLAFYQPSLDIISLLVDKAHAGHPVQSIVHEFGHRLWYKFMSSAQKQEVAEVYRNSRPVRITKKEMEEFLYEAGREGKLPFIITYTAKTHPKLLEPAMEAAQKVYHYFGVLSKQVADMGRKYGIEPPSEDKIRRLLTMTLYINYRWEKDPFLGPLDRAMKMDGSAFVIWFNKEINENLNRKIMPMTELRWLVDEYAVNEKNLYPTEYSKQDVEEFFAENYMAYCLGLPMGETMQNLLKGY